MMNKTTKLTKPNTTKTNYSPERRVGQDAHAVAHHRHLVQGGLAVEQHQVAALHVALDAVAQLERALGVGQHVGEVDAAPVGADDVARASLAGRRVRAEVDQALHALAVEGRDRLWEREVERDRPGHAELVDADVGVAGDDGARGEVDALAHEVAADAALCFVFVFSGCV